MNLLTLRENLEKAWSAETAYHTSKKYYSIDNTARGQCVVTALAVQEVLGGSIVVGIVQTGTKKEKHYWNRIGIDSIGLEDLDIDLTWRQYPIGTKCTFLKHVSRKQLMGHKSVRERYFKLFNKKNGF